MFLNEPQQVVLVRGGGVLAPLRASTLSVYCPAVSAVRRGRSSPSAEPKASDPDDLFINEDAVKVREGQGQDTPTPMAQ